jgi:hypothetical protein
MNTTKLYLLDHHLGTSSGIIYAHKGDEVEVITYCINMVLVLKDSSKFWVNMNKLSDVPILKEKYINENTKGSKKKRIQT